MDNIDELYYLFPEIKQHISVEKKVGQGTFSYVYLGHFCRNESEKLALKYIIPTSSPLRTKQEIECLMNIGGQENVIGVLAVLRNKSHILILMPYVEHIPFHDTFLYWNLEEIKDYLKNLITALNRVHQCGIIHRDVKPSNFLYDSKQKKYALVDFGLAQSYDKTCENIFEYEPTRNKSKIETPIKRNMISLSKKNPSSSLLISSKSQSKDFNEKSLSNSISFECQLNRNFPIASIKVTSPVLNESLVNTDKVSTSKLDRQSIMPTASLQKYYSFQKSSFNISESKCTCFNMPFVCEICTTRNAKWAPRAGTAGFRAPEVLFKSTYQTPSVDIWSVGIIFLSILSGRYPFFKATDDNMAIMQLISLFGADNVRKSALKYGESLICSYDKKTTDLKEICKILRQTLIKNFFKNKNENSKYKILESFPDTAYDLLRKLLELDSEKRYSAADALKHPFFN